VWTNLFNCQGTVKKLKSQYKYTKKFSICQAENEIEFKYN